MNKFNASVSCLCWAYNEELLIQGFLIRLNDLLSEAIEDYEIVVVDDGSRDRTNAIIREMQKTIPQIVLVENPVNKNVGYCVRRAIQSARKEYLFWQTIDWSYDISHLRSFLEFLKDFDVVAGTRRPALPKELSGFQKVFRLARVFGFDHIRHRSDNLRKAMVSLINYGLIRLLFGVPISDYQNVVFYRTSLIQSFQYEALSSFANPEGLFRAYWAGARIKEVPIPFIPRTAGVAKGTKFKAILKSVKDIFRLWFRWCVLGKKPFVKKGEIVRWYESEQFV